MGGQDRRQPLGVGWAGLQNPIGSQNVGAKET